jgi:NAD(P)-dependent dehydrogenase (short-subunit alcohol dehydrogenase family)
MTARAALVCGATGTIGAAVARELAAVGHPVAVHYHRDRATAEQLAAQLPRSCVVGGDLGDADVARGVIEDANGHLGAVHAVVNTVHRSLRSPVRVADLDGSLLSDQLAGLYAHLNVCRAALPGMRAAGWGRIVYLSGGLATRPMGGFAAYAAAKAAAATLTRYLAVEEGGDGITANVVAPGRVTADGSTAPPDDPAYRALSDQLLARMSLRRFPTPQDVAAIVAFLLSDGARQVTGQTISVNGGEPAPC